MEPIQLSFTPTKADYARTTRITLIRPLQTKISLALFVVLASFMVCIEIASVVLLLTNPESELPVVSVIYPLCCIGFLSLTPFILLVLSPFMVSRQVQKNERLRALVTWEIRDDGLTVKSGEFAETKMDWGTFQSAIESKDYYFLQYSINKRAHQFIPKRAFTSPEHEADFRAMVEAHLGPIKK